MSPYFQRIKPSIRTRNVRFRSSGSNKCRAGRLALPRCFNAAYFNGKEKDYESGFHYYGTRYYWSEVLTGWLSVDPMMDKYPNISPYAYCAWNPVKLVDPDGRDFDPTMEKYASQVESYCKMRINSLSNVESLTKEQEDELKELQKAQTEIQEMRDDNSTLYRLRFVEFKGPYADESAGETFYHSDEPKGAKRHVIYVVLNSTKSPLQENGKLSIKGLYSLAHELKHCHQFYNEEVIYAKPEEGRADAFNTPELEKAAFKRAEAFHSPLRWELEKDKPMYRDLKDISHDEFIKKHNGYNIIRHKK